ncbi:MAG: type II secretion system F family protein [Planctomycetota bacterium]|nr:type II secretion system F family protein [Planctomycetota bacterium]
MPSFKYSAIGSDGRTVRGSIDASDQTALLEELRKRSLTPLRVEEKGASGGGGTATATKPKAKAKAKAKARATAASADEPKGSIFQMELGGSKPGVRKREEIVIFTRQLATMIGAGIPMLESLEILREQAASRNFRMLLAEVIEDVRSGQDLSTAFGRWERIFSDVYVSMIKAGEASGQLDDILCRLADYMEASERLKSDIKSAMTYPVVSLVMIFGITGFLMVSIVPKFKEVFASMDIDLPGLTLGVLAVSDFCQEQWLLAIVGLAFIGGMIHIYKRTDKGSYQWDWMVLHLPVFGDLFQKVGLSRFSKTFSTMLKSGVPILGALEIVADTSGNRIISEAVLNARENVRQGEGLMGPLAESPVFPPMVTRMVGIGEKTGSLEILLEKISEFYDDQVRATVKQLTSLIEPIMIAVMGIVVGTICLSVFLPIFELQKQMAAR